MHKQQGKQFFEQSQPHLMVIGSVIQHQGENTSLHELLARLAPEDQEHKLTAHPRASRWKQGTERVASTPAAHCSQQVQLRKTPKGSTRQHKHWGTSMNTRSRGLTMKTTSCKSQTPAQAAACSQPH